MLTEEEFRERVRETYYAPTLNKSLVFPHPLGNIERLLYPSSNREAELRSMWQQYQIREGGMSAIWSYPKVYNLGHRAIAELFADPVIVEEKIDGSQFSFRLSEDGAMSFRSRGHEINPDAPEKMFAAGIAAIEEIKDRLHPGWVYRGEYLAKPKHNTLAYDRIPERYVVIFDIERGEQDFLGPYEKRQECERIGLECVPFLENGVYDSWESLKALLQNDSFLGGQKIEGFVIKNYSRLSPLTKQVLIGKFVSEAFKEVHGGDWKERNPGPKDVILQIIEKLRTPARWQKGVQHLAERGELEDSPRDIGKLIKEVQADVIEECREEIIGHLMAYAKPKLMRGIIAGLPEWYKERLAALQFGEGA